MRRPGLIGTLAASAVGVAAAGAAAGAVVLRRQAKVIGRRGAGDAIDLGSLRAPARTVVAGDGVALHVEIDEPDRRDPTLPTVVFVHGYALDLRCWHFQRAEYRGQLRTLYYDQRSHGRSGRSDPGRCTIDQLGDDLAGVITQVTDGPVVLVGHSMGGMTIVALAERHPEWFGERIVGVGLIATTAGGLSPEKALVPILPGRMGSPFATRLVAGLAKGSGALDRLRRVGRDLALVATDRYAFGDDVPADYVRFVDEMLSGTPFEVLAAFFPHFGQLDKFAVVQALGTVPTWVLCGTDDRLTPIGHSRKLHSRIPGSHLVEYDGAGHLVILERHREVGEALDDLFAAAQGRMS